MSRIPQSHAPSIRHGCLCQSSKSSLPSFKMTINTSTRNMQVSRSPIRYLSRRCEPGKRQSTVGGHIRRSCKAKTTKD